MSNIDGAICLDKYVCKLDYWLKRLQPGRCPHAESLFAITITIVDDAAVEGNNHFRHVRHDHFRLHAKPMSASYFPPIPVDADGELPLYRQIYQWFRGAILSGQLRPGQAVPSTRSLASHLGISRAPVLVAFELLHAEGYLEGQTGAMTRVTSALTERTARHAATDQGSNKALLPHGPRTVGGNPIAWIWAPDEPWLQHTGAFRLGVADVHHFPSRIWSSLLARHAHTPQSKMTGSMGLQPLRVAIAEYLRITRDVHCIPEQIMIVNGTQHGLQIAARVLLGSGEPVWMEDPGYWGARGAFESVGASLVPVPVDDDGLDVAEGLRRKPDARAAYVTPAHQFPMGYTMSVTRRMALLDWASNNDAWIIEDDYDSEFRFSGQPISSLQSLDTDSRVVYIGTFSKVFSSGLRIAYLVIPMDLVPAFRRVRQAIDLASPTLCQLALTDLMQNGHFARHIRRMSRVFSVRRKALISALGQHVGDNLKIVGTVAGLHVVGLLPKGVDDVALARSLADAGISAAPLTPCYLKSATETGLILGYANVEIDEIEKAARVLATVLDREISRTRPASPRQ
jgi:GntR family transcriptional regulator/MocR family aminotransferase